MLQPLVRRTWAPKGQTPVQKSWDRHERLSVIAALTVSPVRQRVGLDFRIYCQNVNFERVMEFLALLRRHLRRKFLLVLDRYSAHRKAVRLLLAAHPDWFEVEWLPAYAPELNPVELVWSRSKWGDLANLIPEDVNALQRAVASSLESTRARRSLLRSFCRHAGLEL